MNILKFCKLTVRNKFVLYLRSFHTCLYVYTSPYLYITASSTIHLLIVRLIAISEVKADIPLIE